HGPVSGGATSSRNEGAQSSRKRGAASSESASPDLRRYAIGAQLRPSALHLHDIAGFYAGLGDRIVRSSPDS
ncbi:hypothetical protein ACGVWT_15075, partial [Sphingomonas sp. S6]